MKFRDRLFKLKQIYKYKKQVIKDYLTLLKAKIYKSPLPSICVDIFFTGIIFSIIYICMTFKWLNGFGIAIIAWYIQFYLEWIIKQIKK